MARGGFEHRVRSYLDDHNSLHNEIFSARLECKIVGTSKLKHRMTFHQKKGLNGRWKVARSALRDANICAREKARA